MIIRCLRGARPLRTCLRSQVSWPSGPVTYGLARAAARVRGHLNLAAADVQMQRCILSVMAQSYPNAGHIIVSDGPDDELLGEPPELPAERGKAFESWTGPIVASY